MKKLLLLSLSMLSLIEEIHAANTSTASGSELPVNTVAAIPPAPLPLRRDGATAAVFPPTLPSFHFPPAAPPPLTRSYHMGTPEYAPPHPPIPPSSSAQPMSLTRSETYIPSQRVGSIDVPSYGHRIDPYTEIENLRRRVTSLVNENAMYQSEIISLRAQVQLLKHVYAGQSVAADKK